jgi:hypothetical protein
MNPTPLTGAKRVAGVVLLAVFALAGCSSTTSNPSSKPSTDQSATGSPTTVEANATPAFSAGSIRVDGPKIAEFSQEELEQQVLACNLDISELITELGVDQTGWNFGYVDASIYSDQFFDSAQQAWDENEIFYFSYNFLGPYKGDYRQQIQIMIGAWKPIGGTSQFSEVKQYAIDGRGSEYVYQLSPENNFAIVIAYGTDRDVFIAESIPLGKIDPVETFVKQLVAGEIPYWVSS